MAFARTFRSTFVVSALIATLATSTLAPRKANAALFFYGCESGCALDGVGAIILGGAVGAAASGYGLIKWSQNVDPAKHPHWQKFLHHVGWGMFFVGAGVLDNDKTPNEDYPSSLTADMISGAKLTPAQVQLYAADGTSASLNGFMEKLTAEFAPRVRAIARLKKDERPAAIHTAVADAQARWNDCAKSTDLSAAECKLGEALAAYAFKVRFPETAVPVEAAAN